MLEQSLISKTNTNFLALVLRSLSAYTLAMPAPRPSHSAEAARAAAAQAEFNEKRWVWVPDDKEGYLAGWVNKEEEDMLEIVMAAGGEVRTNASVFDVCIH